MITNTQIKVFCNLQVEGMHNWPGCPFEEVDYLRSAHRHIFHIKATKLVSHDDRDTEFIMMKHRIVEHLTSTYVDHGNTHQVHSFGSMSCEMIAQELITKFGLIECEVSEDGDCGAIVTVLPEGG